MSRILLTDRPFEADAPRDRATIWICGRGWTAPDGVASVPVADFMDDPWRWLRGRKRLVLLGLVSAITTPSNRVKTGQFFTDPLDGYERWSIDDKLFITDPWRLWWHFGCVGVWFNGCATSYALESRYRRYVEGRGPNPCDAAILQDEGDRVVRALRPFRFGRVEISVEAMPESVHRDYRREKERAFDEERTIAAVLRRLVSFADDVYPARNVPSNRDLFRVQPGMFGMRITATDLGVDRLLVSWLRERIDLVEFAAEVFK